MTDILGIDDVFFPQLKNEGLIVFAFAFMYCVIIYIYIVYMG